MITTVEATMSACLFCFEISLIRKPQFSEEDLWSRVESSKFRPMFAGVTESFHLYSFDTVCQFTVAKIT